MFNTSKQLHIEGFLSHGKPYLASHPELGVPLGIFNTVDEPNYTARVKSIKKLGPKGNIVSLELAKKLGIKNPLPSYQVILKDESGGDVTVTQSSFDRAVADYLRRKGIDTDDPGRSDYNDFSTTSTELGKMLKELSQARSQADLTLGESMQMMQNMTDLIAQGAQGEFKSTEALGTYLDIISLTDQMRKDIINTMGMDEVFMDDIIKTVTDASADFMGWALTANDAMKMLKETAEDTGRAFILPKEAIVGAAKLEEIYDIDMSNTIAQFDRIGIGSKEAVEITKDAIATAGRFGAVVSKFLPQVEANIDKINTYGFQNGVNGLSEMVAKAQVLGYNFENALQMADKAFTPEGAIEMASKLQMIGGAASELLDPFQLMYMAQNDVEGLQDAIVKTAESAVTFNKETGEFGISPGERMRLKSIAEATGQDYNNLAETAIKAAKRTQAIGKLGGIPELSQEDKELIASMADINPDGTFSLTLGDKELSFDELGEVFAKDGGELLAKIQKQSQKDTMNLEDVNKAQLSVQEGMAANTAIIQNLMTQAAASGLLGTTAKDFAGELAQSGLGNFLLGEGLGGVTAGTGATGNNLVDIMGDFGEFIPNFLDRVPGMSGSPVSPALDESMRNTERGSSTGGAATGGAYPGYDPNMINSYLENTPEGQNVISNYINNSTTGGGGNTVNVVFNPLEIMYDGNTIRLTPKQIMSALDPTVIQAIGTSLAGLNVTTPS